MAAILLGCGWDGDGLVFGSLPEFVAPTAPSKSSMSGLIRTAQVLFLCVCKERVPKKKAHPEPAFVSPPVSHLRKRQMHAQLVCEKIARFTRQARAFTPVHEKDSLSELREV